jgi:hypothetical protein
MAFSVSSMSSWFLGFWDMFSKHVQQHLNGVMGVMIPMEKKNLMGINSVMGAMIPM